MASIQVGNAPCSWGTLEFAGLGEAPIGYAQMLDELKETGYTGTELGDWGFMPTDPVQLHDELARRDLVMLGAFVPVEFRDPSTHASGLETALRVARLLASVATNPAPYLILADDNGTAPERTLCAGRVEPSMGLTDDKWRSFGQGVTGIARSVFDATGLRTVFHHHCAGYVETPQEIDRLLSLTDPDLVGLVFDTGHYAYGSRGSHVQSGLDRFGDRIWYVHLKDCHPGLAQRARHEGWDYFRAIGEGLFCELGQGRVDFGTVVGWLRATAYHGYVLVEQDLLPGMGTPKESAARNRAYLRRIGL